MKVFFDGRIFTLQQHGGISRLFFELMRSFGEAQKVEQILFRGAYVDHYPFRKEWFKRYYGLRNPVALSILLIKPLDDIGMELTYGINAASDLIYHATYYRLPKRVRGPVVIHAYDMIHELYNGDLTTKMLKRKFNRINFMNITTHEGRLQNITLKRSTETICSSSIHDVVGCLNKLTKEHDIS